MAHVAAEGLREQVLAAALRRLDTAGPEAVTLRQVAADVGRSTQAIYSHFRNRDDLMHALRVCVAVEMAERSQARVKALEAPTLDEMLEAAGLAILDFALEHPHLYRHANIGVSLAGIAEPPVSADVAAAWSFLLEPLRAARAGAPPRALETEFRLRVAVTHGIAMLAINGNYGAEPRAAAHALLRAAIQLRPTAGWANL